MVGISSYPMVKVRTAQHPEPSQAVLALPERLRQSGLVPRVERLTARCYS
jgi:hypothetical protein